MKTILLILFSILPAVSLAQKLKPVTVEPLRVSIVTKDSDSGPLSDALIGELRKTRGVVIGSKRNADYVIQVAGTRFQGPCNGVVVAVLISGPNGHEIQALAGSDWQEVAALIARQIIAERRK